MRSKRSIIPLVMIATIAAIATAVYAATVSVTTQTYQAQNGVYYQVTGNIGVNAQGFFVAHVNTPASSQPCTWSAGGQCNTAITAGHWVYVITVTLTSNTPASTTYTVTVQWITSTGYTQSSYTQLGQLTFTTPSTVTSGQSMTFVFDTGTGSFNAPAGIVITVQ